MYYTMKRYDIEFINVFDIFLVNGWPFDESIMETRRNAFAEVRFSARVCRYRLEFNAKSTYRSFINFLVVLYSSMRLN